MQSKDEQPKSARAVAQGVMRCLRLLKLPLIVIAGLGCQAPWQRIALVTSTPSGAIVSINGHAADHTPCTIRFCGERAATPDDGTRTMSGAGKLWAAMTGWTQYGTTSDGRWELTAILEGYEKQSKTYGLHPPHRLPPEEIMFSLEPERHDRSWRSEKLPDCNLADLPDISTPPSIAVLDFQVSDELKRSVGESLADVCRDAVLESGRFILIERESIKAILAEEDFAATFKCDDTKCLVDYGKKLSAQKIVHGSVNRVGTSFLITIKILDVSSTKVEGLKTARISGGLEQALDCVQPITCEILRKALTAKE